MKPRAYLGLAAGFLMLAGAVAHGLTGFLPFQLAFERAGVDADVIHASYIGWIWGSFTMLGLGILTLVECSRALREGPYSRPALAMASAVYGLFGIWALAFGGWNPHFVFFVLVGLLPLPAAIGSDQA